MPLLVESDGVVVLATMDRQQVRNALDVEMLLALAQLLRHPPGRAVVLTGAGGESFSAGMDLRVLQSAPADEVADAVHALDASLDAPDRVPVVAALNGPASGGGFEVALRCDLVVAAEHAHVHLPEVRHGVVPGGGAVFLPARIPLAVALELGIVGDPMSAERAFQLGLVNRVAPAADVTAVAIHLARRMTENGPVAVRATRALMRRTYEEGVAAAREAAAAARDSPDARAEMAEGVAAFLDKRPPRWTMP
jgi:enoyl-CoA hydratase